MLALSHGIWMWQSPWSFLCRESPLQPLPDRLIPGPSSTYKGLQLGGTGSFQNWHLLLSCVAWAEVSLSPCSPSSSGRWAGALCLSEATRSCSVLTDLLSFPKAGLAYDPLALWTLIAFHRSPFSLIRYMLTLCLASTCRGAVFASCSSQPVASQLPQGEKRHCLVPRNALWKSKQAATSTSQTSLVFLLQMCLPHGLGELSL